MSVQKNDPYHLGSWILYLRPYTFKTVTFEMTKAEANAMLHHLEQEVKKHHDGLFTKDDDTVLKKLAEKIDVKSMEVRASPSSGFFVKLASRSAKDIVFSTPKFPKALVESVQHFSDIPPLSTLNETQREKFFLGSNDDNYISKNKQMVAFVRSSAKILQTYSGDEAIQTFIRSRRTYGDLKQRELLGDEFSMDICLREWEPNLIPELEFRGFVFNGRLTCLTQYYTMIYCPEIHRRKNEIEKKIVDFWNSIQHLFPIKDYCIDFILLNGQVNIIEINPPAPLAGSGLFHWPQEKKKLQEGPFEFRIVTEIPSYESSKGLIYALARETFDKMFPNYHDLELYYLNAKKEQTHKQIIQESNKFPLLGAFCLVAIGFLVVAHSQRSNS